MNRPVLVSVVTHDDEHFLDPCLRALQAQTAPLRIKVLDSASRDGTVSIARRHAVELDARRENIGYSAGHNANLKGEDFEWALLLNADTVLRPDYLAILTFAQDQVAGAGMSGGKLLRMNADGSPVEKTRLPVIDSTGMYFTRQQRHFDRGSGEPDRGQYDRPELVFGITGAAMLISRQLYDDLLTSTGEFLDEDFWCYREDADLAWRAQLLGWKAVYEPRAVGLHHRVVLPQRRRKLTAEINYHSLKNRYLMRIKNIDGAVRWRCFPQMWLRDLGIMAYVPLLERSSLGAFAEVWRLRKKYRAKRLRVQQARRVSGSQIALWFGSGEERREQPSR